jgi:uncharacterized SAM-binding protein YcdF (DUF218 family)
LRHRPELGDDSIYRCLHAADLYHRGKPCPILVSGGRVDPGRTGPAVAEAMRDLLLDLRVSAADILVEDASRTTYENAVECRKLLEARGIGRVVLVTEARHMFRAVRCFAKQGVDVVPSGCHHEEPDVGASAYDLLPNARAARSCREAMHEWLGVIWYRLRGQI